MGSHKGVKNPRHYPVDGKMMTIDEMSAMLGVPRNKLICRRSAMGGISYQLIVDGYRSGLFMTQHDRWIRHCVHGRWITVKQVAEELNCNPHSIENWRSANKRKDGSKPTLEEAYEHFKGAPKRGLGKQPKKHTVNGKMMTVREAADKYGTTENALRATMSKFKCTLNAAVKHLEERRKRRALQEIMQVLKGR